MSDLHRTQTQDGIEVRLHPGPDGSTEVAVRVIEPDDCNAVAVIRLFYHVEMSSVGLLTLSKVDVVPLAGDAFTMSSFNVPLTDFAFVRIEIMRPCKRADFFREV